MKHARSLCVLSLIALLASPAHAEVSLDYHWSNVSCGYTTGGVTTYGDCSSPSFSAGITGSGSVFVSATFNYSYHDDGMALARPVFWQRDQRGFDMQRIDHEAAIIVFFVPGAPVNPDRIYSTNLPLTLLLGNDTTPDDITGHRDFYWSTSLNPAYGGATLSAFLAVTHTEIAAVPEPSTVALMALGLIGLVGFSWRRRAALQG